MTRFLQFDKCTAICLTAFLTALLAIQQSFLVAQIADLDTDQDGLSDFHETYKHLTDPSNADSDGDGVTDGDWLERREYQYTVRSIVQVMRPVTPDFLNDDYQDARVLDETDTYVELEVIHYPFSKASDSISSNPNWRQETQSLGKWIKPGPSNDWTPQMQKELVEKLKAEGILVEELDDKRLVEQASRWLCNHAKHQDGFTSFVTAWDESGQPYVPDALLESARRGIREKNRELKDQFEREVSAAGMFKHQQRGSCTSSAIYLNGCLKALGIPTRTILCIPIIDAGDKREVKMLDNIQQLAVRQHLKAALKPLENSWSSHTFNEVYVDGRWRRLNYNKLGQGIYDKNLYGLITHVATVNDWADANAHETIGMRQKSSRPQDIFGGNNPYSTISLRDQIGPHCKLKLPEPAPPKTHLVEKIYWTDDPELPGAIRDNCRRRDRFGLIAIVSGCGDQSDFLSFLSEAELGIRLNPKPATETSPIEVTFDPGCFWLSRGTAYIYVPLDERARAALVKGIEYSFEPRSSSAKDGWIVNHELVTTREKEFSR